MAARGRDGPAGLHAHALSTDSGASPSVIAARPRRRSRSFGPHQPTHGGFANSPTSSHPALALYHIRPDTSGPSVIWRCRLDVRFAGKRTRLGDFISSIALLAERGPPECTLKDKTLASKHGGTITTLSECLGHKISATQSGLIVVTTLIRSFRQIDLRLRRLFVGNKVKHRRDTIEPRAFLSSDLTMCHGV